VLALHDVNVDVYPGDFIVLTGPSGSGKTTFLHLCALLDRPSSGTIWLDSNNTGRLSEKDGCLLRARRIGMVFQNYALLLRRTALENVAFRFRYLGERSSDARARALATLEGLGLTPLAHQPTRLLSGGEKQRVAIARAVAARPSLLLADEPTGNLDASSADRVIELFHTLRRGGLTVVVATHNEAWLQEASRHWRLEQGTLREVTP
jgi:putative ABC transport system ATP-binding protein